MDNMNGSGALHQKSNSTKKVGSDVFVNPGTSATPFVSIDQRKSGRIEGAAAAALKNKALNPNG